MKRTIALLLMSLFIVAACTEVNWVMPEAEWMATRVAKTAEPSLVPTVTIEPQVAPDPTAIAITEEEEPQVACDIKANVGSSGKIFHVPGGAYYDRVKVDIAQGDFWACSEQEAIDAGFRKSSR